MPRFNTDEMQQATVAGSSFTFSALKPSILAEIADTFTIVKVLADVSGSVMGIKDQIEEMENQVVKECDLSPMRENLLLSLSYFDDKLVEIFGFLNLDRIDKSLITIDENKFGGCTALHDAAFTGISSVQQYADDLKANDFSANGLVIIITDGEDNSSKTSRSMLKQLIQGIRQKEKMKKLITILIGLDTGDGDCKQYLDEFQKEVGIDQFIWVADAKKKGKIAKLAGFISKSISSSSQSLATGGPSQTVQPDDDDLSSI